MLASILLCGASVFTACSSDEDDLTPQGDGHAKKALLIILDGWGIGDKSKGDVIYQTATPRLRLAAYLRLSYFAKSQNYITFSSSIISSL